jgi:AMMECR1 domain-containing protein
LIEINILTTPQYISDWKNINLGRDGIIFHKLSRQSVFLPKVASEFGWDLSETLSQLSVKAGLSPFDWQKDAQFEVFQSQSFSE